MSKEEILAKSREENKKRDEMEQAVFVKAGQQACAVGGIVCMVIIILEAIFAKEVNTSIWAVYLSITGTMLLMKYRGLRKKHELIFGLIQLGLAVCFLVMYIIKLVR